MIPMFTATYRESVNWIPTFASGEPIGPITNGITYIVRPFMHPRKSSLSFAYAAFGSIQLFVGPAMSWPGVQMNVHCSVRATSFGLLRCK